MKAENHRVLNSISIVVIGITLVLATISTEKSIEQCSDMLYEHLYMSEAPDLEVE